MASFRFRLPRVSLLLLVMVFLSGLHVAFSGFERNCGVYRPPVPQGMCGSHLSDLISTVCIYYNGRKKRSAPPSAPAARLSQWPQVQQKRSPPGLNQEQATEADIFLPKHDALSMVGKRAVHAKGVICECCYFRCNIGEMAQYCSATAFDIGRKKRSIGQWSATATPAASAAGETRVPEAAGETRVPETGSSQADTTQEDHDLHEKQIIGWHIMKYGPTWLEAYLHNESDSQDENNDHVTQEKDESEAHYRSV